MNILWTTWCPALQLNPFTIKIFNALRYGYTPVMAPVAVVSVLPAIIVFGLIGRFDDLPKLLGAMNPE